MTLLQIHFSMLALGAIVFLFIAGLFRTRSKSGVKPQRQWWLGAIAGLIVALSPFSRFWRLPSESLDLLAQALIVSAIGLLALLLFALLKGPGKRKSNSRKPVSATETQTASYSKAAAVTAVGAVGGLAPIVINADQKDDAHKDDAKDQAAQTQDAPVSKAQDQLVDSDLVESDVVTENKSTLDPDAGNNVVNLHTSNKSDELIAETYDAELTLDDIDSKQDDVADELTLVDVTENDLTISDEPVQSHSKPAEDQTKTQQQDVEEIASVVPLHAASDSTKQLDEKYSHASAANDTESALESDAAAQLETPISNSLLEDGADENELVIENDSELDDDALDLSETEQLFAEIRKQSVELELPDDEELRQANAQASIDELDLDAVAVVDDTETGAAIVDAEVILVDEQSLLLENELDGEYAHPDAVMADENDITVIDVDESHVSVETDTQSDTDFEADTAPTIVVPKTLDEALIAAKVSAVSLQTQVASLEESINELDELHAATVNAANVRGDHHEGALTRKDELLQSEDEARQAAEAVIAAQKALIEKSRTQQAMVKNMLEKERERLAAMEEEVSRTRKMARSAALLARRAAVAQQEIKVLAKREQQARLKSQESTRKAVDIARNAISALAAEERKRGVTHH